MKKLAASLLAAAAALLCVSSTASEKPIELPMGEAMAQAEAVKQKVIDRDRPDSQYPPEFWSRRDDLKSQCLRAIQLSALAGEMDYVSKAANLEEDSKIRRVWFKDISSSLRSLASARMKMEEALENKSRSDYFKALNVYVKERNGLEELLEPKNRPVISEDELKKLKEERKRAQGKAGQ